MVVVTLWGCKRWCRIVRIVFVAMVAVVAMTEVRKALKRWWKVCCYVTLQAVVVAVAEAWTGE